MKYTVSINEAKRTITVTLADGTKGVAKCCPTDHFDINTGIELALERAKVAKANAEKAKEIKPTPVAAQMTVTMLIKQLEKALPKGQMVIVGNGNEMTAAQKKWLHSLTDCEGNYSEGYDDGYADALEEYEECEDAMHRIVEILNEIGLID